MPFNKIAPIETLPVQKPGRAALIASVSIVAFVLGWIGGATFTGDRLEASCGHARPNCGASPRSFDAESIAGTAETARPDSWEAATVTGLRWRPIAEWSDGQYAIIDR